MTDLLQNGSMLQCHRVESVLGRGGFGITYLATDTYLETKVAIKEYLPMGYAERLENSAGITSTGKDDEFYKKGLQRFIEEARILARFKHSNIVRVLGVFEENNTAYMVMEYEHGSSLNDMILTPDYQREDKLISVFDAILSGLESVHAENIIHRDIKPANIYIREDSSPVLLDFGSARQHTEGTPQQMTQLLTMGYAPYEQIDSGVGPQGPWTDIYAIGATLYYAITRSMPSDSLTRSTRVYRENLDPFVPSSNLLAASEYSPGFLYAIDKALEFDAANRPQNVASFRSLLALEAPPLKTPRLSQRSNSNDATVLVENPYPVRIDHVDATVSGQQSLPSSRQLASSAQSTIPHDGSEAVRSSTGFGDTFWQNRGLISGVVLGGISAYFLVNIIGIGKFI